MLTVHELRKRGFTVGVYHYRVVNDRGGATVVNVTDPLGYTKSGTALCSYKDQFNRKLGLRIALGRALKELGMPTK